MRLLNSVVVGGFVDPPILLLTELTPTELVIIDFKDFVRKMCFLSNFSSIVPSQVKFAFAMQTNST